MTFPSAAYDRWKTDAPDDGVECERCADAELDECECESTWDEWDEADAYNDARACGDFDDVYD